MDDKLQNPVTICPKCGSIAADLPVCAVDCVTCGLVPWPPEVRAYAECLYNAYGVTTLTPSQFEAAMDGIAERHAAEDACLLDDIDFDDDGT